LLERVWKRLKPAKERSASSLVVVEEVRDTRLEFGIVSSVRPPVIRLARLVQPFPKRALVLGHFLGIRYATAACAGQEREMHRDIYAAPAPEPRTLNV
jgi:hypothetical protein